MDKKKSLTIKKSPLTAEEWYARAIKKCFIYGPKNICFPKQRESLIGFNKAIELDPKFIDAYYMRGLVENSLEKYKEAVADFTKSIEYYPRDRSAYYNRGCAYLWLEKYKEAMADFTKAIKYYPNYSQAYEGKGLIELELGNYKQALKNFKKALKIEPKNSYYQCFVEKTEKIIVKYFFKNITLKK